jgi:hypothetical protein
LAFAKLPFVFQIAMVEIVDQMDVVELVEHALHPQVAISMVFVNLYIAFFVYQIVLVEIVDQMIVVELVEHVQILRSVT